MAPAQIKPQLWLIAGPNGSGKSSAYGMLAMDSPKDSVWIINPDLLAKRVAEEETLPLDDANLQAVIRIEAWLYASVEAYQTIGVETVLSSDKFRKLVKIAKGRGFEINFIYVYLNSVELNIQRVRARLAKGGHDVPEDKIRERRIRSFEQFSWFFNEADNATVFDNSESEPRLVISKEKAGDGFGIHVGKSIIPEIKDAVLKYNPALKWSFDPDFQAQMEAKLTKPRS